MRIEQEIDAMDNPYWHPDEKGHTVNGDDVRLLAFDIFNIVRSSMSMMGDGLHEQGDDESDREPSPVEALHYLYAELELSKKLLQLSILMRTLDDYWLDYGHEKYLEGLKALNKDNGIGILAIDEKTIDLNIREAFNKILHARDVRPVYDSEDERIDEHARWGMDSQLELKGQLGKREWQATINLFAFLDSVIELVELTEDLSS